RTEVLHTITSIEIQIPPPRRYALFPYTTLFRSSPPLRCAKGRGRFCVICQMEANCQIAAKAASAPSLCRRQGEGWGGVPLQLPLDRKSTRLNSSHVKISYAVFCLKIKKNEKIVQ